MNNIQRKDLKYGDNKEDKLIKPLMEYYGVELSKTKPFYEFDYINKESKILIELKSRRIHKTQYYDTMIGHNKVLKGLAKIKQGYKIYFIFGFTDYVCAYELKQDSTLSIRDGGRTDRGKIEQKKYAFIPVNELINLFPNKNIPISIIPKMSKVQPKTETVKPLTYPERLINYFKSESNENGEFTINDIEEMIRSFSLAETEKRKERTDEMPFGKFKFKKVADVAKFDKQYLKWLIKQDMMDSWTDLKEEINKYL
jgi:hypothetical protein